MNHQKVHDCIRPVCFSNQSQEFPYSIRGTCFLVYHNGHLYAITAKHVTADWTDDQILIPYALGSSYFFPVGSRFQVATNEEDDTDHTDFVVYEIWQEELEAGEFEPSKVFSLDGTDVNSDLSPDEVLVVAGFPQELNSADYDERRLITQPCFIRGQYSGTAGLGTSQITFATAAKLASFDGLSGSPVFGVVGDRHTLRGMMIRGTASSKKGLFINAMFIKHILERHESEA